MKKSLPYMHEIYLSYFQVNINEVQVFLFSFIPIKQTCCSQSSTPEGFSLPLTCTLSCHFLHASLRHSHTFYTCRMDFSHLDISSHTTAPVPSHFLFTNLLLTHLSHLSIDFSHLYSFLQNTSLSIPPLYTYHTWILASNTCIPVSTLLNIPSHFTRPPLIFWYLLPAHVAKCTLLTCIINYSHLCLSSHINFDSNTLLLHS